LKTNLFIPFLFTNLIYQTFDNLKIVIYLNNAGVKNTFLILKQLNWFNFNNASKVFVSFLKEE
jgi:hypothetical protein